MEPLDSSNIIRKMLIEMMPELTSKMLSAELSTEMGYVTFSQLNDFIFCPYSLYLHTIYEDSDESVFKGIDQVRGTSSHDSVDNHRYNTSQYTYSDMSVYSEELGLLGKIDLYLLREKTLIERKYKVHQLFQGQIYQIYGQYYAMREMGFEIEHLIIHSKSDNKAYPIPLPTELEKEKLKQHIYQIRNYDVTQQLMTSSSNHTKISPHSLKCRSCIYAPMCEKNLENENFE